MLAAVVEEDEKAVAAAANTKEGIPNQPLDFLLTFTRLVEMKPESDRWAAAAEDEVRKTTMSPLEALPVSHCSRTSLVGRGTILIASSTLIVLFLSKLTKSG